MGIAKLEAKTGATRGAWCLLIAVAMLAAANIWSQEPGTKPEMAAAAAGPQSKTLPSPPAKARVTLAGHAVTIDYSAPSMRGRKIMGSLVPYGEVWRTGADSATTLTTSASLMIGTLNVPAGKYTLFTLPSAGAWKLIVNKQTGQWGTEYHQAQDLGRTDMKTSMMASPQEVMSINFEKTSGNKTELHVKWDKTDVWVPVVAK